MLLAAVTLLACGPRPPDPEGMVPITTGDATFWIDRYEYPNQKGVAPLHPANLAKAQEVCTGAGKRVCTAAEWRRACLGPDGALRYGYGPTHRAGTCATEVQLSSGHTSMMGHDIPVAPSGSHPGCVTPEGVYDLVGNVEEWTLDDWRGLPGMLEGGAAYTHHSYADCTGRYSREPDYRLDPAQHVDSAGTRCCWTPEAPTAEDIARDAKTRLATARQGHVDPVTGAPVVVTYDPSAEVATGPATFMDRYEYPNRPGVLPLAAVSWTEATALCAASGKRLCSAWEWARACAGPEEYSHPYGSRFIPDACAVEVDLAPESGAYLGCVSPVGAADLVGSLWEWTATPLDEATLVTRPGERLREIRGGSWFVDAPKGNCRPVDGYPAAAEDLAFTDLGFRCCRGTVDEAAPLQPQPARARCPDDMVAVGEFCVDRYELPNVVGTRPTGQIDGTAAREGCRILGKELCTEAQWIAACEGELHRSWPYGNTYVSDRCGLAHKGDAPEAPVAAVSGAHPECRTPEGIFDLSGNLWEWTLGANGQPVLHGGGLNFSAGMGQCRATAHADAGFSSPETGGRCCLVP